MTTTPDIYHISRPVTQRISERVSRFIQNHKARAARTAAYRRTLDELSTMSQRELTDLGIDRADINQIAWQAASKV